MRITKIETIRLESIPAQIFVQVHTDEGLIGLGETCLGVRAVEGHIHEVAAAKLLGKDPLEIEKHSRALYDLFIGYGGTSAEVRGNSAVDIALWDILGQATGQPLYQLLGGRCRERIRIYNTCAGYMYGRKNPYQAVANWNLPTGEPIGPYEDLDAFLHRADELAQSLLDEQITAMKIWPFDEYAIASGGKYISARDLERGLEPFRKIRDAVGTRMEVMAELHALWQPQAATEIARALEEFEPYWIEDAVKADNLDNLAEFKRSTRCRVTFGETLGTRWPFQTLLEKRGADVIMFDVGWVGGISEARKIAAIAESFGVPVAPHDCTGPVVLTASSHLSVSLPNALIQETVRAYYTSWYRELVTDLPRIGEGFIAPPEGPGLGIALLSEVRERDDARVVTTVEGEV